MRSHSAWWRWLGGWALMAVLAACDGRVYVRDGVTDGDRFSLPTTLMDDTDTATQAWAAYSLAKSVCQLEMGGDNPARNSSLACEVSAREALAERWNTLQADRALAGVDVERDVATAYLDTMSEAYAEDVLAGYTWRYLRKPGWTSPEPEALARFDLWAEASLPRNHKPQTRVVGSWGYADR